MKRFLACFVAVALLVLTASACSTTLSDAATIRYQLAGRNHEDHVSRSDLVSEVHKIAANKQFADLLAKQGYAFNGDESTGSDVTAIWLGRLIQQKATDALFASRHLSITPALREQATQVVSNQEFGTPQIFSAFDSKFREELIDREARREAVLTSYLDTSDATARRFYEANKAHFACASGKNVAHILVDSFAKAQGILAQLRNGVSFSELAQKESTDTGSAPAGGSLGCLTPDTYVASFQQAADTAPFDTPVGPVQSEFGYHVILVTHATNTYESARAQVQQALASQAQSEAQAASDQLLKSFKVHVDPRYGAWTSANSAQGLTYFVQPPTTTPVNDSREGSTTTLPAVSNLPIGAG
jgi:peptidyl-prolyl cis-trans isomerase C